MPVESAMKFRMSRTLPANCRSSGSRDAGFKTGSGDIRRALSRISAIGERGRLASIASRIRDRARRLLAASWRLAGSYSLARLNSRKRRVELALGLELLARRGMEQRRLEHRALERDAVLGPVRIFLHRLPVVRDGGVPVAALRRLEALSIGDRRGAAAEGRGDQRERGKPGEAFWSRVRVSVTTLTDASPDGPAVDPRHLDGLCSDALDPVASFDDFPFPP